MTDNFGHVLISRRELTHSGSDTVAVQDKHWVTNTHRANADDDAINASRLTSLKLRTNVGGWGRPFREPPAAGRFTD